MLVVCDDMDAYAARIKGSHDFDIEVDILDAEENVVRTARLLDGQVNFQRESTVRRTATLQLLDPDHGLQLDGPTQEQATRFARYMARVRHVVELDGRDVETTVIVGPISQVSRTGAVLEVEVQDKTALVMLGRKPFTVPRGMNAAGAIYSILHECGERRFRLAQTAYRLPMGLSVGWAEESSPWSVASKIASWAGLVLSYSADGFATLAPRQTEPAWTFDADSIVGEVTGAVDLSSLINYARVTSSDEARQVLRGAAPRADHPLSPQTLGRNGAPRWLPALAEVDGVGAKPKRPQAAKGRPLSYATRRAYAESLSRWQADVRSVTAKAQAAADALLEAGLNVTSAVSFSAVPVFHLDVDDMVRVRLESGPITMRLDSASIPLGAGEMSVGAYRRVSAPPRVA